MAKDKKEEVLSLEEIRQMIKYLSAYPTKKNLAILLQIYTGVRVGELTALKPEDNACRFHLTICRTEYLYFDKRKKKRMIGVKDFPKTENSIRDIILPKSAQLIIDRLKHQTGTDE